MGENSDIQWTTHTFNPWVGCQRVSPGCENCYAESYDKRVGGGVDAADGVKKLRWGPTAPRVRTSAANWKKPLAWNRAAPMVTSDIPGERQRVFCASLADVFEDRPELVAWREDLFGLIDMTPLLDWLLLTKRPENIARLWPEVIREPGGDGVLPCPPPGKEWPTIWLGTTVEDQQRANERIPELLAVPAVVRFLSCEPLLEAVDLRRWLRFERRGDGTGMGGGLATGPAIDWVIIGGESGGKARPFERAWADSLVKQCHAAGAAPFVKQMGSNVVDRNDAGFNGEDDGGWHSAVEYGGAIRIEDLDTGYQGAPVRVHLRDHHGGDMTEWPEALRVREFPEVTHG